MRLAEWVRGLSARKEAAAFLESFDQAGEWRSFCAEARPVFVASAFLSRPRKILVVASTYDRCLVWEAKLRLCGVPESHIYHLPSGASALFEDSAPEFTALSSRIGAMKALIDPEPCIVVAQASAVLERTLPKEVLADAFIELAPKDRVDIDDLIRRLSTLGYEQAEPVRIPGQFARRGGIVDIFVAGYDVPIRIEFFDDEVESLRTFDPSSQRSTGSIPALRLTPSRETLYVGESRDELVDLVRRSMEVECAALGPAPAARLEELVEGDLKAMGDGVFFDRLDLYRPILHPDSGCAIDLLDEDAVLVLDEPLELESLAARAEEELGLSLKARQARGEILSATVGDYALPPEHLASHERRLTMTAMNAVPDWLASNSEHDLNLVSLEPYRGRADAFVSTLKNWREQEFDIVFSTDQPNRARTVLGQVDIAPTDEGQTVLAVGNLGGGFVCPEWKLAVVSDAELFGVARLRLPQKKFHQGAPISTLLDLKPGDYVVHIHFGIGVFRGLAKRTVEGTEKEFLFIEYAAPDKLFVPADQLDRIQKYLNPSEVPPKLNRLTGTEWQKTISKAKEDAQVFARDLVKLYAERRSVQRRPFGPDTPWQAEMESTFQWVETPSQMAAIRAAKQDLQQSFPMDRLVCGDVGFGKTEVAIRAAFKVAQAGRQTVVLCPTTILSEQHFRNFSDRLASFGVQLGLLNRFRSAKERTQILEGLAKGKLDVVIGTHALLSKDIQFKDLGLVVVDEEQKFGVKQKESLKALRTAVDVLAMSATPIPRTLSMALMDIRQMSLINDPPPGRLPIRTFVRPYAKEVVREAILREMARGGQVFYVYNRVEGIQHLAEKLRKLIPHARIGVGHGQMTEAELEPIMIGFIRGEIDILLSTTIVENGIDIPNANTLIVENADHLGLSQLYQLRGRVGRADRQAYAYFLYQSHKDVTENSLQRLQALQEFSSLGSGYSLAFRDLQIRGAGELLGAKQHGAMASVGYELYTQLIEEAVASLKHSVDGKIPDREVGDPLAKMEPLPTLELPVPALIPSHYIDDQGQRLYYYQQMMGSRSLEELAGVAAEIEDRYGSPPSECKNAFEIMRWRMVARSLGIEKMDGRDGRLLVSFRDRTQVPPRAFSIMGSRYRDCYVNRDAFVWPFSGSPLLAVDRMLTTFGEALAKVEEERAAVLG